MITAGRIIDDYSTRILLRCLGGREPIPVDQPRIDLGTDLEYLQCHWAISNSVKVLARYVIENRHETQSLLAFRPRVDDAIARGRIDARATLLHRLRSGVPTALVTAEPIRSYAVGPNQVLAWVLRRSWQFATQFLSWHRKGTPYEIATNEVLHLFNQVRRIDAVSSMLGEMPAGRRPIGPALVAAERSRRKLYRLASDAYRELVAIEHGDRNAISRVLNDTLLGPMEDWRRLELAVALAFVNALAEELEEPVQLKLLGAQGRGPIVRCGSFSIFWQSLTDYYEAPHPEPSEVRVEEILAAYGMTMAADRPDLVVIDEAEKRTVGVIEVKFHAGDDPSAQFRSAVQQLVRYCRGYADDPTEILQRSAVAMNFSVPSLQTELGGVPAAFSFDDILKNRLGPWIKEAWLTG